VDIVSLTLVARTQESAFAFTRALALALADGAEAGLGVAPGAPPDSPVAPDFTVGAWARVAADGHRSALARVELAAAGLGARVDRHEVLDLLVVTVEPAGGE
jgi:hypothetical protein